MQSWKDRTYEGIPTQSIWARVYWRAMELMDGRKGVSADEATKEAERLVANEDNAQQTMRLT